jgi:hypothetical protein
MVTVGIDPHKHVHVAVAVGDDGTPIGKPLTARNDALLILTLLKWVRSITDGTATWAAIEDGRGFARQLADGLLLAGQEVVWVPARLAAAHRRLHEATGAKSDPIDAAAVARAAIAQPGLDRHRIDERVRELRVLVDYRADLVKRRTMAINQLKAQVHLWLDQAPGDLTRARNVNTLATLISTAQLGCSQLRNWSAITGPGPGRPFSPPRLRAAPARQRPTICRSTAGRPEIARATAAQGTAGTGNSPDLGRAVPKAGLLPKRDPRQPESMWPGRRHDSACASRPRAQPIRTRSPAPWPCFRRCSIATSRSLRACADWPASPRLGGRHSLAGACCPGRGLADRRRAAAGLV